MSKSERDLWHFCGALPSRLLELSDIEVSVLNLDSHEIGAKMSTVYGRARAIEKVAKNPCLSAESREHFQRLFAIPISPDQQFLFLVH